MSSGLVGAVVAGPDASPWRAVDGSPQGDRRRDVADQSGRRGGICLPSTGYGRPSTTGIAAGQRTEPGFGCCGSYAAAPMRTSKVSGPWGWMPQSCGRIITRPGQGTCRRRMYRPRCSHRSGWRLACGPVLAQGAASNDKDSAAGGDEPVDRECLGHSRGGLTTKIHLAADLNCRPISRVTSAGQRHDSLAFTAVLDAVKIDRGGPGRPRTRPDRVLADKAYSTAKIRDTLRRRKIKATIPQLRMTTPFGPTVLV